MLDHRDPIGVRQAKIENDQIGAHFGRDKDRLFARPCFMHMVAATFQANVQKTADLHLIINNQDLQFFLFLLNFVTQCQPP